MGMVRAGLACGVLVALGCGAEAKRTASPTHGSGVLAHVSADAGAAPEQPVSGYVLAASTAQRYETTWMFADENGSIDDAGIVVGNARVAARLSPRLGVGDDPQLTGGMRVPEHQGGGFLFWTKDTLFFAREFLGALLPVAWIPGEIVHLAAHPKGLLARFSDGSRALFEPGTFRRLEVALDGIADVRSLADGRALAVLYGGEVRLTRDGGATWRAPSPPLHAAAVAVDRVSESLWLRLTNGETFRLGADGALVPAEAPGAIPAAVARTDAKRPTLEHAVATGLRLDASTALVYFKEAIWGISLPGGAVRFSTPLPLTSGTSCELVRAVDQELLVCQSPAGRRPVVVYAGLRSRQPVVEAVLATGSSWSPVAVGFGILAWDGGCGPEPVPGHVCIRTRDAEWVDRDSSTAGPDEKRGDAGSGAEGGATAAAAPSEATVRRWIPAADGDVLAWMNTGAPRKIDARKGTVTVLAGPGFEGSVDDVESPPNRSLVDARWQVDGTGRVRGFRTSEIVEIDRDHGRLPTPPLVGSATWALPHGFACDSSARCWQTLDAGRAWEPIGESMRASATRCSEVGCVAGPIVRLGWEPHVVAHPRETPAEAIDRAPAVKRARVVCERSGDARILTAGEPSSSTGRVPGLGTRSVAVAGLQDENDALDVPWAPPVDAGSDEALLAARLRPNDAAFSDDANADDALPLPRRARDRIIQWLAPFDPTGEVRTTKLPGPALLRALREAGAIWNRDSPTPSALPVLEARDAHVTGLLLRTGNPVAMLFLEPHPDRVHAYFPATELSDESAVPLSAIGTDPARLAVLYSSDEVDSVVVSTPRGSRRDWQRPRIARVPQTANPPALAVDGQGELAILYAPSGAEPSTPRDPVIAVQRSGATARLAPWSSVKPASAPECQASSDDYRAVFATSKAWVDVVDASAPVVNDSPMYALVRWSAQRVCVDALELLIDPVEGQGVSTPARLIVRFDTGVAARYVVHAGFELRQPMTCRLDP